MKVASLLLSGVLFSLGACAHPLRAADPPLPSAVLVIRCNVRDAVVWVDDRLAGEVEEVEGGIRLLVGAHRVELRHDQYYTCYRDVVLQAGREATVELEMIEVVE
jgi:hypothetical protein